MPKRIYSNYSEEEVKNIEQASEKCGMSISALQRYALLYLIEDPQSKEKSTLDTLLLTQDLISAMWDLPHGGKFIVSSLLPAETWMALDKRGKLTMSQVLKKEIERNPMEFQFTGEKLENKTNFYNII